jgi:TfoX/Sxy family transcriptional regulator of competence genes
VATKKPTDTNYAVNLALYEKLVATDPSVERKGATMPYTSHNGNMFSLLTKDGSLALRLSEKKRENFIKKYKAKLHEAYGVVMKEYVTVPDSLLKNTKELKKYFDLSVEYVKSLKPKATTKGKTAKKKK